MRREWGRRGGGAEGLRLHLGSCRSNPDTRKRTAAHRLNSQGLHFHFELMLCKSMRRRLGRAHIRRICALKTHLWQACNPVLQGGGGSAKWSSKVNQLRVFLSGAQRAAAWQQQQEEEVDSAALQTSSESQQRPAQWRQTLRRCRKHRAALPFWVSPPSGRRDASTSPRRGAGSSPGCRRCRGSAAAARLSCRQKQDNNIYIY